MARGGFRFWVLLAVGLVAAGFGALIQALIFSRAVVAWGFFGTFIALACLLVVFAWFYDRRQARRRAAEEA